MRRHLWVTLLALGLCCLAGTESALAQPQSFARWVAQEGTAEDAIIERMSERCVKRFSRNDAKLGACVVQGLLAIRPALVARWDDGGASELRRCSRSAANLAGLSSTLRTATAIALGSTSSCKSSGYAR